MSGATSPVLAHGAAAWHFVTSEYPPDVGGVSGYTWQLARAVASAGDEVHVWCPGLARPSGAGVAVHAELGSISRTDLRRLDARLDAHPAPRRLLVQWVPHGYGYRSMNVGFCLWLGRRARRGDHVELIVHEPYMEFNWRSPSHSAMAAVHRVMTLVVLSAARRVWIAIPAWEACLRPYALGRDLPMSWLPIPGCLEPGEAVDAATVRARYAAPDRPLVGHFGSHGTAITALLDACVPPLMGNSSRPSLLLLGADGPLYRDALITRHRDWRDRVHAAGFLDDQALAAHLGACDLLIQPYPDGVTSRRTSVMACLSQARPVVTTCGRLTEPLWSASGAVALADAGDPSYLAAEAVRLLADADVRGRLGAKGRRLYDATFSVDRVVTTLRAA